MATTTPAIPTSAAATAVMLATAAEERRLRELEEASAKPPSGGPYDTEEEPAAAGAGRGSACVLVDPKAKTRKVLDSIAGVPEYTPQEHALLGEWREVIKRNFELFGFSRFTPDPVLSLKALTLKGGLSHEMYGIYRMTTAEGAGFGPPFDRTVPLARYVAKNAQAITYPWARYDIGNSWRAEAPGPGRFRIFEQCDVDWMDTKTITPEKEADCLAAIVRSIQEMHIGEFTLCINHLTISKALLASIGVPEEKIPAVLKSIDKLEKIGESAVVEEIMAATPGLDEGKVKSTIARLHAPAPLDGSTFTDVAGEDVAKSFEHLRRLVAHLARQGIDPSLVQIRPSMVRGLDYYTGFVFETFIKGHERLGSIASGGAYDNLVGAFNPAAEDICGCGASLGLTRLFYVMREIGAMTALKRKVTHDITVLAQDPEQLDTESAVTGALRGLGYRVAMLTTDDGNLGKQLRIADRWGAPVVIIARSDGQLALKRMDGADEEQTLHPTQEALLATVETLGIRKV